MPSAWSTSAQRRPGPRPRRHSPRGCCSSWCRSSLNEGRGRDPGDTATTIRSWSRSLPLNEGRGRDPGDTVPPSSTRQPSYPLNEGRGRDPGDTRRRCGSCDPFPTLNEGRGRDPGDTLTEDEAANHVDARSTKAGAETPATLGLAMGLPYRACTLNEGRGRDPGDTCRCRKMAHALPNAQRRPGPRPRRHC